MKSLLRARPVQSLLAWLVAGYVETIIATVRWRFEGRANVDLAMASPEGVIALFWHGRIAQGMACRPLLAGKPRQVMISLSRDGEFIAMAAQRLKIPPIRGSAGRGDGALAKGGASAFRQALSFLRAGGVMILTPDGPRGPREVLPAGPAQMARTSGCPVFLMSLAADPALTLRTWDRTAIPLPFARGQVVLEGPLRVADDADDAALEAARADWQNRMRAGQTRAEALLRGAGRATLGLAIYALAARAVSPLAPALLHARARAGKEDPARLGERLGRASLARPEGRLAWLHGASVGESLSLLALARRLRAERPQVGVLVTSGTRASAQLLGERLPAGALHQYAPVDTPGAARRFLDHWRPDLVVIAESELWPNLILGARQRGARLALVSARLSPASLKGWGRAPRAARALLGAFDLVLARDKDAAASLRALGVRVDGVADMKLAAAPLPADQGELAALRIAMAGRPAILAASTHGGEEALILERFAALGRHGGPGPLLIIAPRHADRGSEIERLALEGGFITARRGAGADLAGVEVYVADTVGELGLWYRLAGLAFLGGSLTPGGGGHNPLEPARLGCAFVAGPHTGNWPVYDVLEACGASARVAAPGELDRYFRDLLEGPAALAAMAGKAQAFVAERDARAGHAADCVLALIDP